MKIKWWEIMAWLAVGIYLGIFWTWIAIVVFKLVEALQ